MNSLIINSEICPGTRHIRSLLQRHSCHIKPIPVLGEWAILEHLISFSLGRGDETVLFYLKLHFTTKEKPGKSQGTEKGWH